jgi:hypothetical protein
VVSIDLQRNGLPRGGGNLVLVAVGIIDRAVEKGVDLGPGSAKGASGLDRVIAVASAAQSIDDFIEAGLNSPEASQQNTKREAHFKILLSHHQSLRRQP